MPRGKRIKADDLTYHVFGRGNNKIPIFHNAHDYDVYLNLLRKYKEQFSFNLHHFCLMPTHPHLLIQPNFDISKLMHRINLSYAIYHNARYNYVGHLWQDRFKSYIVSTDKYLLRCARYIETNPERMARPIRAEDYPYSSYRFYAYGKKCDLITKNPMYDSFGSTEKERRRNYKSFVNEKKSDVELPITDSCFIASPEYVQSFYDKLQVRMKRKPGRPKKNSE